MKKIIFALFILINSVSYCQNSKIRFGLQAGLNYSSFRGNETTSDTGIENNPGIAFLGGFSGEYQMNPKLSFRVELNFERKSEKGSHSIYLQEHFDDPGQVINVKSKMRYDYLVMPILIKYTFNESNGFYVNGGPFVGYLLKSQITNNAQIAENPSGGTNTTDLNKKLDYGIAVGLGKNFEIGSRSVHVEIRENLGLCNTSDVKVWNDGTIKTNSISLIAGFTFN